MVKKEVVIRSKHGLHARPSAKISELAQFFGDTNIRLIDPSDGTDADAKSILSILTMTKESGQSVIVTADGPDEQKAVDEIVGIIDGFSVDN